MKQWTKELFYTTWLYEDIVQPIKRTNTKHTVTNYKPFIFILHNVDSKFLTYKKTLKNTQTHHFVNHYQRCAAAHLLFCVHVGLPEVFSGLCYTVSRNLYTLFYCLCVCVWGFSIWFLSVCFKCLSGFFCSVSTFAFLNIVLSNIGRVVWHCVQPLLLATLFTSFVLWRAGDGDTCYINICFAFCLLAA